jgi:hypothetical protein
MVVAGIIAVIGRYKYPTANTSWCEYLAITTLTQSSLTFKVTPFEYEKYRLGYAADSNPKGQD